MRGLLDTHSFLWFIEDSPRLSAPANTVIEDGTNEVVLSMASLWEMAIKSSLGKLTLSVPFGSYISQQLDVNNIRLLDITPQHIAEIAILPFHHRDPFDRLLIAQAKVEQTPLLSVDSVFDAYTIRRIW